MLLPTARRETMAANSSTSLAAAQYWGAPDATVDWCEQNYAVSPYVAEFYNALSSLPLLFLGVFGAVQVVRYAFHEKRFAAAFGLLAVVGLGSTAFHATMRYSMQLTDELPMLYCNMVFVFVLVEDRPRAQFAWLPYALLALASSVTTVYLLVPTWYAFFVLSYAGVILFLVQASYRRLRGVTKDSHEHLRIARALFTAALFWYGLGSVLWVTENSFCQYLPGWWKLHAMWHLCAGYGTYTWINMTVVLRAHAFDAKASMDRLYAIPFVHVDHKTT